MTGKQKKKEEKRKFMNSLDRQFEQAEEGTSHTSELHFVAVEFKLNKLRIRTFNWSSPTTTSEREREREISLIEKSKFK